MTYVVNLCNMMNYEKHKAIKVKILKCSPGNFYENSNLGQAERIMLDLFWLEESVAGSLYIFELKKYNDREDKRIAYGMYNDAQYNGVFPPAAIALNYNMVNYFVREWAIRFNELNKKQITRKEYFEWKINWPASCDNGGRFEPSYNWRNENT